MLQSAGGVGKKDFLIQFSLDRIPRAETAARVYLRARTFTNSPSSSLGDLSNFYFSHST